MRWIIQAIRTAAPEFISAFEKLAALATRAGVEGRALAIHAPLITLDKAQIIRAGIELGVDFGVDRVVLPGGRAWPGLRPLRFLPHQTQRLRGRRVVGSHPLSTPVV